MSKANQLEECLEVGYDLCKFVYTKIYNNMKTTEILQKLRENKRKCVKKNPLGHDNIKQLNNMIEIVKNGYSEEKAKIRYPDMRNLDIFRVMSGEIPIEAVLFPLR